MIERGQHLRLAPEPGKAIDVCGNRVRQDFDGDITGQRAIRRPIHFAHSAGAEQRDDLVRADPRSRSEAQGSAADYSGGWPIVDLRINHQSPSTTIHSSTITKSTMVRARGCASAQAPSAASRPRWPGATVAA